MKLSYPERVTDYNIEAMRTAIIIGPKRHPGANIVERTNDRGELYKIALHVIRDEERRKGIARDLKIGDVVHRHVRDGE
jgi:DNA-directed RNA polymerase III subunit RPC1